ncbi:MAG: septum formation initiator family protein [Calditrichaeota bacterium]|nr:MAG: septum formation initiator family protein [Calditrichota bacterium]
MAKKKSTRWALGPLNSGRMLILAVLAVLIGAFLFADRGLYKLWQVKKERDALLREIELLKDKKKHLEEEKHRLEKDIEYIEKTAREKYNMKKPGETVYDVKPR